MTWVLSVQLEEEWEECSFATRQEALATFAALTKDYTVAIRGAVLASSQQEFQLKKTEKRRPEPPQYIH